VQEDQDKILNFYISFLGCILIFMFKVNLNYGMEICLGYLERILRIYDVFLVSFLKRNMIRA